MMNQEAFLQYRKSKSIDIRNQIVEAYLYMVEILIRKYMNKGVDYDDLYQVGAMALVSAVDRFDPDKGFEFSSFATPTILGEIKKYFRDKEWSVKVPRRTKEISLKIPAAKEELTEKLGRLPTVDELAEHLNLSSDEVIEAMESGKAYATYSLNQASDPEEVLTFDKFASIEEKGYKSIEDFEVIKSVFKMLADKEKKIFKLRYLENKTQAEIAENLGVSQMTISRAEKNIRKKFHEELNR
ncbi:SigB/SigF/SigG family RNA polymerase sigma factor [Aminipila luticellarii]|uniref:SigB/SigF/SigG family RNA polymerase sigma factor n=1 Tax=Aminipila luticellarii TaxID=2507160 RepID=A0A410PSA1_9FIRM|nr:SigB/SigF/SigG family RNA polymerase sigma factor [Aminipila luticellarii]QAT41738.1 SigB/SigF/SigG family RNA polymerase sigma factor [Aminipila luticellarii]